MSPRTPLYVGLGVLAAGTLAFLATRSAEPQLPAPNAPLPPPCASTTRTLQAALARMGYLRATQFDGYWSPETRAAAWAFLNDAVLRGFFTAPDWALAASDAKMRLGPRLALEEPAPEEGPAIAFLRVAIPQALRTRAEFAGMGEALQRDLRDPAWTATHAVAC